MAKKIARTIAEAKKMGVDTFTGKDGKAKAAVTREELAAWEKKSGKKGLRAFLNARNSNRKLTPAKVTAKRKLTPATVTAKRKLTPATVTAKRKLTPAKVTASYKRTKPKPKAEPFEGPRVSRTTGNNNKKVYRGNKRTAAEMAATTAKKTPVNKPKVYRGNKRTAAEMAASAKKPVAKKTVRRKPTPVTRKA